jgi:glycosyltransferase involved in cell wall biosynthesis
MNIGFYSHYFTPEIGAPSARIYDLSQQWLAIGHPVQVVTCFPNHPMGKLYEGYQPGFYMHENLDGISVHRHWSYITPNKGLIKKTLGHISYLLSALIFRNRYLEDLDITIGTSPTFFAPMAAAWTAFQRKIPFIMEVRDLWPAIFVELGVLRNPSLIRWLERWELALYRQATRVVTVTEAFRHNLIERGVPASKVVTIRNGADVEFWQPIELEGRFVALYIGAHGISHALGSILESAARLRNQQNIQFLFVGEGAEKDQLIRQAEEARLANVHFLDPVDKHAVREFYAVADVCLVPLRDIPLFQSFIPSKMFEIMSMERPIIGSVRGETADILRESGGALVVEPEDSEAIAQAVLWIYEHPDEAQAMGQRGRQFMANNYSRRSLAELYVDVMNEAILEFRGSQR